MAYLDYEGAKLVFNCVQWRPRHREGGPWCLRLLAPARVRPTRDGGRNSLIFYFQNTEFDKKNSYNFISRGNNALLDERLIPINFDK